jgi:hypothetical protein
MSQGKYLSWAMQAYRQMASSSRMATQPRKVAVLGAAGGIGQPLSMLMKVQPSQSATPHQYGVQTTEPRKLDADEPRSH